MNPLPYKLHSANSGSNTKPGDESAEIRDSIGENRTNDYLWNTYADAFGVPVIYQI